VHAEVPRVARAEVPKVMPPSSGKATRDDTCHDRSRVAQGVSRRRDDAWGDAGSVIAGRPGSVASRGVVRPTLSGLRKRMSRLCSWHTRASSCFVRHRPRLLSTSTSTLFTRQ
jgi:hypothetical protein